MKKIILSMIFAFAAMTAAAQTRTTMDILTSYKWVADDLKGDVLLNFFKIYTTKTYKTTIVYDDETLEDPYEYYLSDAPEATFDQAKVGQVKYGTCIMAKSTKTGEVSSYMIITLNETELSLIYWPYSGNGVGKPIRFSAHAK